MSRKTTDLVADILGTPGASTLITALHEDGAASTTARATIATLAAEHRAHLAQVAIAHSIERLEERQAIANGRLAKLEAEHHDTMSGKAPACRHMEHMITRFYRYVAITICVPVVLFAFYEYAKRRVFAQTHPPARTAPDRTAPQSNRGAHAETDQNPRL